MKKRTLFLAAQCPTCRGPLVTTRDAIGRTRERCPRCQGVAPLPLRRRVLFVAREEIPAASSPFVAESEE